MDRTFLRERPAVAEKVLLAISDTIEFINKNRKAAAEIVAKAYRIPPEDAEMYMVNNIYEMDFKKKFVDHQRILIQWLDDRGVVKIADLDGLMEEYINAGLVRKLFPGKIDF